MSHSVTEAIEAFARGEIVIVTDDDDRENEGDLIVAASLCTPEKMAFIIRNTCGIVCAPLTVAEARRLRLDPMVASNDAPLGTAFTVTVDVKHGLTTGISAEQRSNTVRALANNNMGAADFVRPGHVFPLIAKDGGVLMRSGHTEAAVDLCRLAGLPPVGVICELANDDGTVMKGAQIDAFAEKHSLQRISVADLIAYRQAREKLVERIATFPVETEWGAVHRLCLFDALRQRAAHGASSMAASATARTSPCACTAPMRSPTCSRAARRSNAALQRFAKEGRGVLVYLRDGTAGVPTTSFSRARGDGFGGHALEPVARDRPRRADPAGTSASPRSATSRPRAAPMWASPASASSCSARNTSSVEVAVSTLSFRARLSASPESIAADGSERGTMFRFSLNDGYGFRAGLRPPRNDRLRLQAQAPVSRPIRASRWKAVDFDKPFEVVAAFENRDDPPAAMAVGEIHQLLGRPGEIRFGEVQARPADRANGRRSRPRSRSGRARRRRCGAGSTVSTASRNASLPSPALKGALTMVPCSPRLGERAGAGIERRLVGRAIEHARVATRRCPACRCRDARPNRRSRRARRRASSGHGGPRWRRC